MRPIFERGFTLIELMVTVAIVGILAAIALPAYSDYLRRGQVSEALANLADARVKMEQYYQDNRNYGSGSCGVAMPAAPAVQYFTFTCALTASGQGYTLTATGANAAVVGSTYTLDEANQQKTTSFKGAAVSKSCWLIKGGEC